MIPRESSDLQRGALEDREQVRFGRLPTQPGLLEDLNRGRYFETVWAA